MIELNPQITTLPEALSALSKEEFQQYGDFSSFTFLASYLSQAPSVLITAVVNNEQFVLASHGLNGNTLVDATSLLNQIPYDYSGIAEKKDDSEKIEGLQNEFNYHYSILLKGNTDNTIGTLSVLDVTKRSLSKEQKKALSSLSLEVCNKLKSIKLNDELKRAKKRLAQERRAIEIAHKKIYLQSISEKLAKVGHWEVNLKTNEVYWSDETKRIHEADENYIPNLEEGINFYDEDSKPIITKAVTEAIEKGKKWDLTLRIITVKGNKRWVRTIGEAYGKKGKRSSIFGVFQDITDEKLLQDKTIENQTIIEQLNEQLRSKVKKQAKQINIVKDDYKLLYNEAPDMMVSVDPGTAKIVECNTTLLSKTGYKRKELIGTPIFNLYHPDCLSEVYQAFETFQKTGLVSNKKLVIKKKNGELIHVALNVKSVLDENGNIIRSNSIWRDIGDLIEAENKLNNMNKQLETIVRRRTEELNLALKDLEDFTYITTHDLKSPISTIKGYTNILDDLLPDIEPANPMVQKSIEWIKNSTKEAESKINSVLELVNAKGTVEFEFFPLKEFIDAIYNKVAEKNPTVKCIYTNAIDSDLKIYFNQVKFKRIVENIISNAFKYKKLNGNLQLSLSATTTNGNISISFKDNGLGFNSAKNSKKVFNMFTRLHDHVEGNGMGLHLTKKILETYKGNIEVLSQVDKGSDFKIIIPTYEEIKKGHIYR